GFSYGSQGSGPGEFDTPTGIAAVDAFDQDHGLVVVADTGNHRVQVIEGEDVPGSFFFTFRLIIGAQGTSPGKFQSPEGIALDTSGNIYVTDTGNDRIQVFSSNGIFQGLFGESGTGDGQFDGPTGIAVTDEYVYVCDSGNT